MAKCKTCGAPVNLAPDGDPKYESPYRAPTREAELREALEGSKVALQEAANLLRPTLPSLADNVIGAHIRKIDRALSGSAPVQPAMFGENTKGRSIFRADRPELDGSLKEKDRG